MKKKSKLATILSAFKDEIPVDEKWFQERMEICDGCDYNSENIEDDKLTFAQNAQIKTLCEGKPMCTACGCCLARKLGQKTEACGLRDLSLPVKWEALMVQTSNSKDLDLEILDKTADKIQVDLKQSFFIVSLGDVTEKIKEVQLQIHRKKGLRISRIKPTCSCTVPNEEQIDENTVKATIKINTAAFTNNSKFEKSIDVVYFIDNKGTNSTRITFVGHKKQ